MACPIPPLAPQCVAVRRNDVRLGLCGLLGGPSVAALLLLPAPARQHCCPRPCRFAAAEPGRGCRCAHRPSEGHSAQLLMQPPPPLNRQTLLAPPATPWDAPRVGGYSSVAPSCAHCMTCMPGPGAHHTGFAWGTVAALFVSPPSAVPFFVGGRVGDFALVALARPLVGRAGRVPPVRLRSPPLPPAAAPQEMGVGVDRYPLLLPPPLGGFAVPGGGGG